MSRCATAPCSSRGHAVTCFSTAEERVAIVKKRVPFFLQDELRKRDAHNVENAIPMTPFAAAADGRLLTGQNPYSTKAVTAKIVDLAGEMLADGWVDKALR